MLNERRLITMNTNEIKVIDISYHNGNINFSTVKAAGINHVIIRAGYGDNYASQHDKKFDEYMKAAISNNMYVALYLYSYADNPSHAKSEAQHIISQWNKYKEYDRLSKVLWLDIEEERYIKNAKTVFKEFKQHVLNAGFIAGLYTGEYYLL